MIAPVDRRNIRWAGILLIVLVLLGVFLVAVPHDALHEEGQLDCQWCFVQATETPQQVRIERPRACVERLAVREDGGLEGDGCGSDRESRAPPQRG